MGGSQSKLVTSPSEQSSNKVTSTISPNATENALQLSIPTKTSSLQMITRQTCDENVYIMRGKDGDRAAWHAILVSYEKLMNIKQRQIGSFIQVEDFGRNIEYLNKAGVVCQASGYGTDPPDQLIKWINENYDPCTIDENTTLTYITDDIRLCTIQRVISEQPLGISLHYHRHERFHYITLSDNYSLTLAFHAGIKSFDRVIEYNGINIEDDSTESLTKRINNTNEQLLQLLVCSPATYAYYKKNNQHLHSNLNTVNRLKPMRNITNISGIISENKDFCAVRWEDDHKIDAISLTSVCKPSQLVQLYETYTIQIRGWQRQGQIIFIGSKNDCELLQQDNILPLVTLINSRNRVDKNNSDTEIVTSADSPQVFPKQSEIHDEKNDDERKRKEREKQNLIRQLASLLIDNAETVAELYRTQCHGCGSLHIHSDRYKCLECFNYDLCGRCFDQRRETLKHVNGHAMVHFSSPDEIFGEAVIDINKTVTLKKFKEKYNTEEHIDIECNVCKIIPIEGLRFKCDVCHNFHLCITCMEKREHDKSHPLLAIGKSCFLEIPISDIELGDELGRGGFGTVYKAKWLSKNRQVACKVINVSPDHEHLEKSFRKELAAYTELSGPYILKIYGYNIQELLNGIRKCMLVMELMPRGSLSSVIRRGEKIPLRRKLEMACQIASGMRKLHAHRMIHRDIRPDNILVTQDYTAKIGDMGLARVWLPDDNLTVIGCQAYMPFDFYTGKYTQSLDVYTFGLTLNELFTEKRHQFNQLTRRTKLISHSPVLEDLIVRCIRDEPSQRPSAIEIETTLSMYKQTFEKYIVENNIKYGDMSIEDKNWVFIKIYEALHPEIDKILKRKFPPAPLRPPEESAGIMNDAL